MFNLKVENDSGDVLPLTGNKNYAVYKIEGLNPPQASINSSVNATTDGMVINSTRIENRNIVIYMTIEGDVEANRINLYKYFPVKKTVTLYFSHDSRDVYIKGVVELIECDLFSNKQVAQISIICPKPYFKDVDTLITSFSDVTSLFEFPFAIDKSGTEISTAVKHTRKKIINSGDIETGAIIEIYAIGTVVNPVIYNTLERTNMSFNITMQPSDKIVINTNAGEKSITLVRNGISTNALGYMRKDSTWFSLTAGDNAFAYDCDSGSENLQVTFTTTVLYLGV